MNTSKQTVSFLQLASSHFCYQKLTNDDALKEYLEATMSIEVLELIYSHKSFLEAKFECQKSST